MGRVVCKTHLDIDKIILSSRCCEFKTENFIKKTRYITCIDFFISKISQVIIVDIDKWREGNYQVKCENGDIVVYLQIKKDKNNLTHIIFWDCGVKGEVFQNDQRIVRLIKDGDINIVIEEDVISHNINIDKLYLIYSSSGVVIPKLSDTQKSLVEIEDQHVVVQGVAGSGKTNVCIDKILFSACRNYKGKVLYTTYSRGLLNATKLRVEQIVIDLEDFVQKYNNKQVVFVDNDHKKALENKYGIFFFSDDDMSNIVKINNVINFLKNKVDYCLIEDLYHRKNGNSVKFANENYFIKNYIKNMRNHQLSKELKKLEGYSYEVLYKEIFGIIFGFCTNNNDDMLSVDKYIEFRGGNFTTPECQSIYLIAKDYYAHCKSHNMIDTNIASKRLIANHSKIDKYSLSIIDEVQDYTQVNLSLIKAISLKCFCVGDALQMINPSYFSFGYLKNLLYEKDVVSVAELKSNYRNNRKIAQVIDGLGELNTKLFGRHNFVFRGVAVDESRESSVIKVEGDNFVNLVEEGKYDNFTVVVSSVKEKDKLKTKLPNQEILTISEIKGLERDTVVLYNVLSDNKSKWDRLGAITVNRKKADENSVYRYYFNLFYVGVSRAKQNLFVVEDCGIKMFEEVFGNTFEVLNPNKAIEKLNTIVSKLEFTLGELVERVDEFLSLGQFDNARFSANKISDEDVRARQLGKIEIFEKLESDHNHQEGGVRLWELGLLKEAKEQFVLSGDKELIELIDACQQGGESLNTDIVKYYPIVQGNSVAQNIIIRTLQKDYKDMMESITNTTKNLKFIQRGNYGKK